MLGDTYQIPKFTSIIHDKLEMNQKLKLLLRLRMAADSASGQTTKSLVWHTEESACSLLSILFCHPHTSFRSYFTCNSIVNSP